MSATLPAPPARRSKPRPWLWRAQGLLSNYLPLVLMALLASGTWWLVKNTPLLDAPGELAPPRHVSDYRMNNFELQRIGACLLYTSPSPRDATLSRMPSSA